jgi:predicted dehydrogenase
VTIRVAIVGCGWIGAVHSRALKALIAAGLVDAAVVACADSDPARAADFAQAHRAVATTDPAEAMALADAVWICTPTSTHRALVEEAARRGLAIYAEKPLAASVADVDAMCDTVAAAGVPSQVGLVLRHAAPLVALTDRLWSEAAGRTMGALLRDDQYLPNQGRYASSWRADVAQAGGGALIEHSIHDVDLLAWLLGPITEVSCRTESFAGHPGIEDVAAVRFHHQGGASSVLLSVWHQVLSRPSLRHLEVFAENEMLSLTDETDGPLRVERSEEAFEVPCATGADWAHRLPVRDEWRSGLAPYAAAARSFLDALTSGRGPQPGFEVARTAHRVVEGAYRSAAEGGRPVEIALL